MKFHVCIQLFAIVILIFLPSLDAGKGKKKTKFSALDVTKLPDGTPPQPASNLPLQPISGSSNSVSGGRSSSPTNPTPHSSVHKPSTAHKHEDSHSSGGTQPKNVNKHPSRPSSPTFHPNAQSLSSQSQSALAKNPFASISSNQPLKKQPTVQPLIQPDDFPSLSPSRPLNPARHPSPSRQPKPSLSQSSSSSSIHSLAPGTSRSGSSGSIGSLASRSITPSLGIQNQVVSQPKRTWDAVDDTTCADQNSPADKCFNFFILSIFWPPGLAYQYKSNNPRSVNSRHENKNQWSIHGLWPAVRFGEVPSNCHKRRTVLTFTDRHLKEAPNRLWDSLQGSWINIADSDSRDTAMVDFWRKEFDHHGFCATRVPSIGSDVGYFQKAVDLFNSVNLPRAMSQTHLGPGTSMNYGNFVDKLDQLIGSKVQVKHVIDKVTRAYYIAEIRVCFDLEFNRIDCPWNTSLSPSEKQAQITHLLRVPAVQNAGSRKKN